MLVTADWGSAKLAEGRGPAGSVLDATQSVTLVETQYGGRYVSSLAGQEGDGARDWLFWINGIEADTGATEVNAVAGDHVWWDIHRWGGRVNLTAIVGLWPAPISRDLSGPVVDVTADPAIASGLKALGLDVAVPAASSGPRVLVGDNRDLLKRDDLWRRASADPAKAGLTVWFESDTIVVWDADQQQAIPVPKASAIMVATTEGFTAQGAPVVVIAGRTNTAAEQAAQLIGRRPELPQRHFAICLDEQAVIVCSGGRGLAS